MSEPDDLRGLRLSLVVYLVVFALKLVVYFASGVMALLAEALHTFSDIVISGFLLIAAAWARKAADETHMFGHRRAENVAALVASTLFISFTSLRLYEEAIPRLFHHEEVAHRNLPLVVGVLGFSMLIAAAPLVVMLRHRGRGAAAKAQFLELINDELGLLAALVGTLFLMWGERLADPIAAIVVATIIALNAVGLLRENSSFLLGRSPERAVLARIQDTARAVDGVLDVHDLRAEYVGPDAISAQLHIVVRRGVPVEAAHAIAVTVQDRIRPLVYPGTCVIHVDPERE
jgi:cation diffusion facilitator family transporter